MRVNTKIRYGLRTVIEIAVNGHERGLLQKEISEHQKIPFKYLDKIIAGLKSAGLITNIKGKKSGYILNRLASEISVYDIYNAFESNLEIIHCISDYSTCCRYENCVIRSFWNDLNNEIKKLMMNETIEDLVQKQKEKDDKFSNIITYEI